MERCSVKQAHKTKWAIIYIFIFITLAIFIFIIAYAGIRTTSSTETVLGVELPKHSTVVSRGQEESFHGDGCRYFQIAIEDSSNIDGTIFDKSNFSATALTNNEKELIQTCSQSLPKLAQEVKKGDLISGGFHHTNFSDVLILFNVTTKKYLLITFLT